MTGKTPEVCSVKRKPTDDRMTVSENKKNTSGLGPNVKLVSPKNWSYFRTNLDQKISLKTIFFGGGVIGRLG